ncbi:MAG: hypothetical protein ACKVS9_05460 [Phycisphaerae bacterium]
MNAAAVARAFLVAHGVICAAFAAWCILSPQSTAAAIGLAFATPAGKSEYLTVYGGIQGGLALLFCTTGARRDLVHAGLLASACILGPVALIRVATLLSIADLPVLTYVLCVLEVALASFSVALLLVLKPGNSPSCTASV